MATDDFFRSRLDQMIDPKHPLSILASKMPWEHLEKTLSPLFEHKNRPGKLIVGTGLFGPTTRLVGHGVSNAGRPRLPFRLMAGLLYLKHAYNLSDEQLVERWADSVHWQYFCGQDYYEPRFPCDPTQIGRFRKIIGQAGCQELLKATIDTAVQLKAIKPNEFEQIIVDTTVVEKAIAYPTDSRLLEIARYQLVKTAKAVGYKFKQTYAREGKQLRFQASRYAHAKQFKRMRRTIKRQKTILGIVLRDVQRKLETSQTELSTNFNKLKERITQAQRLLAQQLKDKNKLYALHAPEVECISKGKAHKRYEFGVKGSFALTHQQCLIVGARSCPGSPYDGHTLAEQLKQTQVLLEDQPTKPKQVYVDLGYRGVDADNPDIKIIHSGKYKSLSKAERKRLKRRQAIEPIIGHLKADHGMARNWLKGALGDAVHVILCAAGFNFKWLLRAIARFLRLIFAIWFLQPALNAFTNPLKAINTNLQRKIKLA